MNSINKRTERKQPSQNLLRTRRPALRQQVKVFTIKSWNPGFCFMVFPWFYIWNRILLVSITIIGTGSKSTVMCHNWPYGYSWLLYFCSSGDVSTQHSCPISKRRCVQHWQAGALVVVCSQSRSQSLPRPEVTLYCWQDVKIQELTETRLKLEYKINGAL